MKERVINFLGQLDTVNPIPPQLTNNEPTIFHITSGQTFSLLTGQRDFHADEMPPFITTTSAGQRVLLAPEKVIKFLLIDYARSIAISENGDPKTEYLHIKEHLLFKTGFTL